MQRPQGLMQLPVTNVSAPRAVFLFLFCGLNSLLSQLRTILVPQSLGHRVQGSGHPWLSCHCPVMPGWDYEGICLLFHPASKHWLVLKSRNLRSERNKTHQQEGEREQQLPYLVRELQTLLNSCSVPWNPLITVL